jgi:hypothetical protein
LEETYLDFCGQIWTDERRLATIYYSPPFADTGLDFAMADDLYQNQDIFYILPHD